MRIDGRAVAMQMALESLGRYWLFKIGFDEEIRALLARHPADAPHDRLGREPGARGL